MNKFVLLIVTVSTLPACGGGGGSSSPSTQPPSAIEITSTPVTSTLINRSYQYQMATNHSNSAFNYTAQQLPSWLSLDDQNGFISGFPNQTDLANQRQQPGVSILIDSNQSAAYQQWQVYLFNDQTTLNTCSPTYEDYSYSTINSISDFHESRNMAALYLSNYSTAESRGLSGGGVDLVIYDNGIATDMAESCAITYQATPVGANSDSHGSAMARYIFNYANQVNMLDYPSLVYPDDTFFSWLLDNPADIVSMSIAAQNNGNEFSQENADAMADLIRSGVVISHSIGNISGRKHDFSAEEIWAYNPESGLFEATGDYIESFKLAHYYSFLANIRGYEDLNNASGALVQVQAAQFTDPLTDINNGVANLSWHSSRAELGLAKYHGISVIENGNGATSQAAASFSAIVSLMMERSRQLSLNRTGREIVDILFATATDIGDPGVDEVFGHGLVDIDAALTFLESGLLANVSRPTTATLEPSDFSELYHYLNNR